MAYLHWKTYYFAPNRELEYCDDRVCQSVCLFQCPSVSEHISRTSCPTFTKLLTHVTYVPGSVHLCRRCDMFCNSGFMDDDVMLHVMASNRRHNNDSLWSRNDWLQLRILKLTHQRTAPNSGRSLACTIALLHIPSPSVGGDMDYDTIRYDTMRLNFRALKR